MKVSNLKVYHIAIILAFIGLVIAIVFLALMNNDQEDNGSSDLVPDWVAVGEGDHQILTSVDGKAWDANAIGTSNFDGTNSSGNAIAYGTCNGTPLWVAAGTGTSRQILTSVDGLNWQANATGTSKFGASDASGTAIAYGTCNDSSLWVAVGKGTHNILTSVDGKSWDANATGTSKFGASDAIGLGIAYGTCNDASLWVAVGIKTIHQILTSVDGKVWDANAIGTSKFGSDTDDGGYGIAYGTSNGTSPLWVAVGNGTHEILTSGDGKVWDANAIGTSKFGNGGNAIAYGTCNGMPLWVAVGEGDHQILTSVDGKAWDANATGTSKFGSSSTSGGNAIAYGTFNNMPLWVAVGEEDHQILTSVDGKAWDANATGTSKFGGTGAGEGIAAKHLLYGMDSDYYQ